MRIVSGYFGLAFPVVVSSGVDRLFSMTDAVRDIGSTTIITRWPSGFF
jgi:hypothetical protein